MAAASAMASSVSKMQEWALAQISSQTTLKPENIFQQIPASLLDKSFPRWETTSAGEKALGSFTLRKELQGRCLIVFIPGSNTPTCSNHVPELVKSAERLNKIGVKILIVSVDKTDNLYAWAKKVDPDNKLHFIPDVTGEFTLACGLGAWSDRLSLIANRAAVVLDEAGTVMAVLPEVDGEKKQCNAQYNVTGKEIEDKVVTLFADQKV